MAISVNILNKKPGERAVQILVNANSIATANVQLANLCVSSLSETCTDWSLSRVWWSGAWTLSKGNPGATDVLYLSGAGAGANWDLSMAGMSISTLNGGPGVAGANLVLSSTSTGNSSIIVEVVKIGSSYSPMAQAAS